MNKRTIANQKQEYLSNLEFIAFVFGMDETYFKGLIFEAGCEFTENQCEGNEHISREILFTEGVFWPWWTNQWYLRDKEFIENNDLDNIVRSGNVGYAFVRSLFERYVKLHSDVINGEHHIFHGYSEVISRLSSKSQKAYA
jgi:hypothetical protein